MSSIQLVLADVDGTLVTDDKVLTDRSIAAVHALHDANIRFAVTSGRPPRGMAMLIEPLALQGPIAAFNGGLIVNPDMRPIEQKTLPAELVPEILEVVLGSVDAWVYADTDWLIRDPDAPHVAKETRTVRFDAKVVPDFDGITANVEKITGVSDDHDRIAQVEADLRERFGDRVGASRSQPYYVDVTHPAANKGSVVGFLAHHYGIDPSQIATIGDMPNDVSMFRAAGLSIAMGQAGDDVRAAADQVTATNQDEGFAQAIERFVLS